MGLKEDAIKGIVWSAFQSWGNRLISFVIFILLARLLDPKVFGLVALASVFIAFVEILVQQGFGLAIVQFLDLDNKHLDTAFWINVTIGIVMTLVGIFGAEIVAAFFKEPTLTPVVRWLSLSFIVGSLSGVQQAILRRELRFKILAICSTLANIMGGVVGVILAFLGHGVWSLIFKTLLAGILNTFILWFICDWRPGFEVSRIHFKELYSFSLSVLGSNILDFFSRNMDDLLIGYFLGPVALGYYSVSYRLLRMMNRMLAGTINRVALPTFSKLQKERDRLRHFFYNAVQLTSFIAFPAFIGIGAVAPEFVRGFFGEQWTQSIPVMQVLVLIGLLQSISLYNGTVMVAMGKPSWQLGIKVLNTMANVIVFTLVVRWGIVAVAFAFVIRGYILAPLSLFIVYKLINIRFAEYFRQIFPSVAGSVLMFMCLVGIKKIIGGLLNVHLSLIVYILAGASVYLLSVLIVSPVLFQQTFDLTRLALNIDSSKKG